MPKKYRLSGEEIRNLTGRSASPATRRIHGRFFSLLVAPIAGTHAKCAIVVSKKVDAKAVGRNKIKRRARNIVAKRISSVEKSFALVWYAKREVKGVEFSDLERDIDMLFSKVQSRHAPSGS